MAKKLVSKSQISLLTRHNLTYEIKSLSNCC
uniref:Uncharacterized protein n=1 Tax=Arundo donax TaxID=35708 RepID=A0A0A9B7H7_ARUDO